VIEKFIRSKKVHVGLWRPFRSHCSTSSSCIAYKQN